MPSDTLHDKLVNALPQQRTFEHPNLFGGWECPICKTCKDAPVVLIGLPWTERGGIVEAEQVHAACWALILLMRDKLDEGVDWTPKEVKA